METTKAGSIVVFVIGLLGIILSASWDWIAAGNECCMGNYQTVGIAGSVTIAIAGAVLWIYRPKSKEEKKKKEEKKEEK
ncbi:MAG: hypothetical protein QMC80_05530 [Thermoplasmatales archaeon]|nr:hypothetical protein [Thermoplasmatales archaeon]